MLKIHIKLICDYEFIIGKCILFLKVFIFGFATIMNKINTDSSPGIGIPNRKGIAKMIATKTFDKGPAAETRVNPMREPYLKLIGLTGVGLPQPMPKPTRRL